MTILKRRELTQTALQTIQTYARECFSEEKTAGEVRDAKLTWHGLGALQSVSKYTSEAQYRHQTKSTDLA